SNRIVARDLGRPHSDEDGPGALHLLRQSLVINNEMLGRCAVGQLHRLAQRCGDDNAAVRCQRLACRAVGGHLLGDRLRDATRQCAARGDEHGPSVRIVFCLRNEIGREPACVSLRGNDENFSRPRVEIDSAVGGHQCLRRRDVAVAGTNDLVHAWDRFGPIGERCNRVRAAEPEQARYACLERGRHHNRFRTRADRDHLVHAGGDGRNGRHQQRRRKWITAARNVAADTIQCHNPLLDRDAATDAGLPATWNLPFRDGSYVGGGAPKCAADRYRYQSRGCGHLLPRNLHLTVETVECPCVTQQRRIAMLADVSDDLRHTAVRLRVPYALRCEQLAHRVPIGRCHDSHSTILLSGYSTIPWPPAAFSFGIRSRTVRSSMIVLTATHSSSLNEEIVGRCSAGSCCSTLSRSRRRTFSIRPTRPCASIAARSSDDMFSSFVRFHPSASASPLAMSCVFDSRTVSRIRNRFARSVEPVSVASTMASASTGGLTSVAPHENSTRLTGTFSFSK